MYIVRAGPPCAESENFYLYLFAQLKLENWTRARENDLKNRQTVRHYHPRCQQSARLSERSYQQTHDSLIVPMRPRTQTTRTNHLGYDVGSSRKIPDGALARSVTTKFLDDS